MFGVFKKLFGAKDKKNQKSAPAPINFASCRNQVEKFHQAETAVTAKQFSEHELELINKFDEYLTQHSPSNNLTMLRLRLAERDPNNEQEIYQVAKTLAQLFVEFSQELALEHIHSNGASYLLHADNVRNISEELRSKFNLASHLKDGSLNPEFIKKLDILNYASSKRFVVERNELSMGGRVYTLLNYFIDYPIDTLVEPLRENLSALEHQYYAAFNDTVDYECASINDQQNLEILDFYLYRLVFVSLAELCKKTTFLPLTYHEAYFYTLKENNVVNEVQDRQIKDLRQQVILHGECLVTLLTTQFSYILLMKLGIEPSGVLVDNADQLYRSYREKVVIELFAQLMRVRYKRGEKGSLLYMKDMEQLQLQAAMLNVNVDFRILYLFMKYLGL